MDNSNKPQTILGVVTEIGTFGNLNMQDPTVQPIQNLMERTTDPYLKQYLAEQMQPKNSSR